MDRVAEIGQEAASRRRFLLTRLGHAVNDRDITTIRDMMEQNLAELQAIPKWFDTSLATTIYRHDSELFNILLATILPPEEDSSDTPDAITIETLGGLFLYAANCGNEAAIRAFLELPCSDVDFQDGKKQSALWNAVDGSNRRPQKIAGLKLLLERSANIELADNRGRTPLSVAAASDSTDAMEILLDRNANIESTDNMGRTPLSIAVGSLSIGAVKFLLERNANIESTDNMGRTPLSFAADSGSVGAVDILLEAGAIVDTTDDTGETPLMKAVGRLHHEVAEALVYAGATVIAMEKYTEGPGRCSSLALIAVYDPKEARAAIWGGATFQLAEECEIEAYETILLNGSVEAIKVFLDSNPSEETLTRMANTAIDMEMTDIWRFILDYFGSRHSGQHIQELLMAEAINRAVKYHLTGVVEYFTGRQKYIDGHWHIRAYHLHEWEINRSRGRFLRNLA
ncbi:hypothetical protein FQN49_006583 [Arthroderma sp. PD_2]|nr:hypothetical protein FQN49_006583 [Arthroderma sp. PD_2]